MGYNQHHAGMRLIPRGYKGANDSFQTYDKYAAIIAEANIKKRQEETTSTKKKSEISSDVILKNVELCNFVLFATKRGEFKQCICGGRLNYKEKLVVRYREKGIMKKFEMNGKQCVDCERKMLVKSEVVERIRKIDEKGKCK